MDFVKLKTRIYEASRKYKYVWIVLLAGMVLMMMPGREAEDKAVETQQDTATTEENDLEDQLERILSYVKGAGQVKVMLAVAKGESTIYQTDSTYSQGENNTDTRTQTILITDSSRNETGLIYQKNPPVYQGAIVLAQGADDPEVKLAIVDAVMDATGLGADKISVLKMQ